MHTYLIGRLRNRLTHIISFLEQHAKLIHVLLSYSSQFLTQKKKARYRLQVYG